MDLCVNPAQNQYVSYLLLGRNGGKQSKILAHDGVPKNGLLLCLQHTCRIGDRHGGRRLRTADSVAPAAGAGALVLKLGACGQTPHVSHATGIRRAYGGHNVRMHAARTALARGARDGHTRRIRQKRGACNCNGSSNVCNVSSNVPSRPFFGTACSHLPALAVVTKVGKANAPKHCAPAQERRRGVPLQVVQCAVRVAQLHSQTRTRALHASTTPSISSPSSATPLLLLRRRVVLRARVVDGLLGGDGGAL